MGCPEKSAIKSGGGAAMCLNPALAAEVLAAAKTAGLPVSAKCRLGYSKLEEWQPWISHLLQQDIANLTVHLRTKKEMSKVPAHWELMPEIKKLRDEIAPQTTLIGNGDVLDRVHGESLIAETGIDGVMLGRGVFHNPFCFENTPQQHSKTALLELLTYHLELFNENQHQRMTDGLHIKPYETLKRFFKIYVRDFHGSQELRTILMETQTTTQALEAIHKTL
jgi:tRNA-dihydrouridine synthase